MLSSMVAQGDATATAGNILDAPWLFGASLAGWIVTLTADIAITVTLYLLLKPEASPARSR